MHQIILKDWSVQNTCAEYGYPMYVYTNLFQNVTSKVMMPAEYREEDFEDVEEYMELEDDKNILPDIILILNETFYDPAILIDLETDVPYLKNFYNMENAVTGKTITPVIGGDKQVRI